MSGLVSHVVWIRPSWDRDTTSMEGAYDSRTIGLGWFMARVSTGKVQPYFCECELDPGDEDIVLFGSNKSRNADGLNSRRCSYITEDENADDGEQEIELAPHQCHLVTSYKSEHVVESKAFEMMTSLSAAASSSWLGGGTSGIIIDIDEDFFGCEIPSDRLVEDSDDLDGRDRKLTWSDIEVLDELVAAFVCPNDANQEDVADRLVRRLLRNLTAACAEEFGGVKTSPAQNGSTEDDDDDDTSQLTACRKSFIEAVSHDLQNALVWTPSMFCAGSSATIRSWAALAHGVISQLPLGPVRRRIIDGVGFCLSAAPRTLHFGRHRGIGQMNVCHGANGPNSTLVYHYKPKTIDELDARLKDFDRLLSTLVSDLTSRRKPRDRRKTAGDLAATAAQPGVVTVCRSVRDGYTPRDMAMRIEAGVLSSVKRHLGVARQRSVTVVYDQDLLAGESGWDGRSNKRN